MDSNHVMATYKRYDMTLVEGKGSKVYDSNGKEYIDFVQGVAVNCLGHSNDKIIDTINNQSSKLIHVSNYFWNEYNIQLSNILCQNSSFQNVFICNSGAEAVEGALKVARKYGKIKGGENKNIILHMNNSFHGRTLGSLSVTGQSKYQKDYLPLLPAVKEVTFNDIQSLKYIFNENVCALIIEPIQGEGGVNVADKKFLQAARDLCDKYDALLIFDEIQCGIGRLGTLFAYESFGVEPDVAAIAKALGGGFPIGAFLTNEKASVLSYGDHGSTYGGNPLGSAVATTVIKELIDGGVIASVKEKSQYFLNKLKELKNKYDYIKEIRGMGLLLGIKIKENPSVFINKCIEKGLLLITAGADVVRFLPALNVSKEDIDSAISIMEAVIKES
ncbi:MAG TPA: aspartate aminotransferase family protein [Clostridium sp.]|jgi:acetylornithine/N-succinyldiaminopimelate aminotransferase|nr:aspartate aminotransferase family protein [Clostridia bacterium]HCW05327.1 aspartate aminotransferase family protein [Clostridium sp.]